MMEVFIGMSILVGVIFCVGLVIPWIAFFISKEHNLYTRYLKWVDKIVGD